MSDPERISNEDLRARLDFTDEQLGRECDLQPYQASGPGGQKRNRTYSAVRIVHRPSGLATTAAESRSQLENRRHALKRLRETIAVHTRIPLPLEIHWPEGIQIVDGRFRLNTKNPALHHAIALALDAVDAHNGGVKEASLALGITSSCLTRFLSEHPRAWTEANRIRQAAGLQALHA